MKSYKQIVQVTVPTKRKTRVIVVSDVHLGAIEHNAEAWKRFCKRVQETPDTYVILAGDLINNSIASSVANPFDEVMRPQDQKRAMVDYLMPIRDRILCAVSGNHEGRTAKATDQDVTYDIMSKLDLEDRYRPELAVLQVRMERRGRVAASWFIAVTHGAGGGFLTGGSVNKIERFAANFEGLDVFVMGHTHKPSVTPRAVLTVQERSGTIGKREIWCIVASSWLDYGGYAAAKMLAPTIDSRPQTIVLGYTAGNDATSVGVEWT